MATTNDLKNGMVLNLDGQLWSIVGFYCRVKISGRPPVSNMYESVIWVGFMTAVFGLVLELVYRRGVIALAATLVSTFGLPVVTFHASGASMSASAVPPVWPVLFRP